MRGLMADAVLDEEFRELLLDAFLLKRRQAVRGIIWSVAWRAANSIHAQIWRWPAT
jgi:hypothetical protein